MLLVCIVIAFQSSKITEMSFYHFTTEKKNVSQLIFDKSNTRTQWDECLFF